MKSVSEVGAELAAKSPYATLVQIYHEALEVKQHGPTLLGLGVCDNVLDNIGPEFCPNSFLFWGPLLDVIAEGWLADKKPGDARCLDFPVQCKEDYLLEDHMWSVPDRLAYLHYMIGCLESALDLT